MKIYHAQPLTEFLANVRYQAVHNLHMAGRRPEWQLIEKLDDLRDIVEQYDEDAISEARAEATRKQKKSARRPFANWRTRWTTCALACASLKRILKMLSNPEIARGIAHWLANNPDASEEQRKRAHAAILSCLNADRNDHRSDICRRLHRMNLARFAEIQLT